MPRSLRDPSHPYHPRNDKRAKGRGVCLTFALEDLIHLARWKDHRGLRIAQSSTAVRFLSERWNTPRSTVHGILRRFEADGYIRRIPQLGRRDPDVIEIVGYADFVAKGRTAYLQCVSDAECPVTARKSSKISDTDFRRPSDKEILFATGESEVRLVGRPCSGCGRVEVNREQELCGSCLIEIAALDWCPEQRPDLDTSDTGDAHRATPSHHSPRCGVR